MCELQMLSFVAGMIIGGVLVVSMFFILMLVVYLQRSAKAGGD